MTKTYLENANLDQIKLAIAVEEKHQYIDIRGKETSFSGFMIKELRKIYKLSKKNTRWLPIIEAFEHYAQESMPQRKKILRRFITILKGELNPSLISEEKQSSNENEIKKSIYEQDVTYVKGVGPKVAYLLNKLGIFTVFDLINYFPNKHIDYSNRVFIKDLKVGEDVTIFGKIKALKAFTTKNNLTIINVRISDETDIMELNFFYQKANRFMQERYKAQFPKDANIIISGKVKKDNYTGKFTIDKPQYQLVNNDFYEGENLNLGRLVPVYSMVENLSPKTLRRAIYNALFDYKNQIENLIPDKIQAKHNLLDRKEAIEQIHFPKSTELLDHTRYTLVFEELFLLQLKLALLREANVKDLKTVPLKIKENGLVKKFVDSLPFTLTDAQQRAVNEILKDINSETPMQRLLQGDVGSGKTVVACIMLLAAIENGYQAAIMAPTEILAQQHFNNFISWLTPLGISTALFTSSNNKRTRTQIERNLRNGQINIAVGTHSLIQENIEFSNLGAIVIDEQHRFGVKQRNALREKASQPQMLTMTATPIPRTLALTVHGDLDLTIIDELPKGRKPIKTVLINMNKRQQAYNLIRQQIELGHQAYIIFPLIDESETLSAKAATKEAEELKNGEFSDLKIGLLHGKMKPDEKDEIMKDFKDKKYNILVSTTVVEVGVDVPNATVMMIEDADRFGLSQLHQLRGRVGRSKLQSYCILTSASTTKETLARLNILTQTNDGFVIAEKDLELRGPGEFLGVRQSGLPELHLTDLTKDIKILELTRAEAFSFIKENDIKSFKALNNYLETTLASASDIAG
ncbi:MAG: ATP-dependent DNA helicase RecG [Candidatus Gastranaerophilales bacterium]|nr:ATP-dependent DNA helicase RecG [Candidatus Gastranaerophilales bacterium]